MTAGLMDFRRIRKVLLLGAHADDIEIGCGGTVLRMLRERPDLEVQWHVFSAPGVRRREATESAREFLKAAAKATIKVERFEERYFPDQWTAIKSAFDRLGAKFEPDVVFTHRGNDHHQDHRVLSELTWNTFRRQLICEYEIPKYEGDLGQPNLYVRLEEALCRQKVETLMRCFPSQRTKYWFSADTFLALMRLRGIECGPSTHYAEAFHSRKIIC